MSFPSGYGCAERIMKGVGREAYVLCIEKEEVRLLVQPNRDPMCSWAYLQRIIEHFLVIIHLGNCICCVLPLHDIMVFVNWL